MTTIWKNLSLGLSASAILLILAGCNDRDNHQNNAVNSVPAVTQSTQAAEAVAADAEQVEAAKAVAAQPQINVEEVEKLLSEVQAEAGTDWIAVFEKRVNEIYEGDQVISIDARLDNGTMKVIGYIEKNWTPGYQNDDELVFEIDQQGQAQANGQLPVQVTAVTRGGQIVQHQSSFASQMMWYFIMRQLMSSSTPRYYTAPTRFNDMRTYRDSYRNSSSFAAQQAKNSDFARRLSGSTAGSGSSSWTTRNAPPGIQVPKVTTQTNTTTSSSSQSIFGFGSHSSAPSTTTSDGLGTKSSPSATTSRPSSKPSSIFIIRPFTRRR